MSRICPYLFVYGTLRAGSGHPMARVLTAHARPAGAGSVAGRLYDLGEYPGLVGARAEGERVRGEVYELDDPAALLAALDRYEGCAEEDPRPRLFERRLTAVALDEGKGLTAWVYEYRGSLETARRLASGDYFATSPPEGGTAP
jgi:gamma-glutamylcyclotransferase (GGCT)/AIG2-like uncharacterized protein YtfP